MTLPNLAMGPKEKELPEVPKLSYCLKNDIKFPNSGRTFTQTSHQMCILKRNQRAEKILVLWVCVGVFILKVFPSIHSHSKISYCEITWNTQKSTTTQSFTFRLVSCDAYFRFFFFKGKPETDVYPFICVFIFLPRYVSILGLILSF